MEPWDKFRNLCQYYIDCVKYSEKSQEYLFPDRLGKDYLLPRLPLNWHLKDGEFEIETDRKDAYVRNQLLKSSDEDELFIGYPLNSFISPDGFACLCPVMMFPVSIAVRGPGYTTGMKMQIDRQGISINQDWIDYHIPFNDRKPFRLACEQSEDETGCLDVNMILDYMAVHFKEATVDPNRMQFAVRNSESKECILNTAVLFAGTKTKYTKTLISELRKISKEPDSILDKTALAYVFRDPVLPNTYDAENEKKIPVSFTKRAMNDGQFLAVEGSLNKPVIKVMGPPGTGKSFMSVNLIANEVLAGGSVLFTSKNHKAIHAIFDKAPEAIENKDFPLVSFCTTPDNPTNADWQKSQKDVDARVDRFWALRKSGDGFAGKEIVATTSEIGCNELDVYLSAFRDAETHIVRYQELRELISRYERLLSDVNEHLVKIPQTKIESSDFTRYLEEVEDLLLLVPRDSFMQKVLTFVRQLTGRRMPDPDFRSMLKEFAPELANKIVSRKTMAKEVRRLLELLKCREVVRAWGKVELEALKKEESDCDFEMLKSVVKNSLAGAESLVQRAYLERLADRVLSVKDPETIVARCKNTADAVARLNTLDFLAGVDDGARYENAIAEFKKYLDVFPAWAATMLSLRRVSPCLPGIFSLAVIDEASQCEIPPMIPVLFRARRAAIVGDPNQFPPVITLKESRDKIFLRRYRMEGSEYRKFAYRDNNVFAVVPGKSYLLNEHFRCADGIAEYFNEEFYDGELSLCCDVGRDGTSAVGGLKPGMMWIDASGGDAQELEAAMEYLAGLTAQGFKGSIGVISPLRDLANQFKTLVASNRDKVPSQLDVQSQINTANGFQGGECDLILFLLGLNGDRSRGEEWYITAAENKYIFNVSVSRAKRLFVAIGDRKKVALSGLSYIQRLIPEDRPPRKVSVGPGEEKLRIALKHAGVETVAQYPVLNRYLDLAIPALKIDIEVDGQAWHIDCHGCRKSDDIHRDVQLEAAGWRVVRVWHSQVVSDISACIEKVRAVIKSVDEHN